jgi:hypothetical protein
MHPEEVECRLVRFRLFALSNRPGVGLEPEPFEVFEDRGVVRGAAPLSIVVLDPEQDP